MKFGAKVASLFIQHATNLKKVPPGCRVGNIERKREVFQPRLGGLPHLPGTNTEQLKMWIN